MKSVSLPKSVAVTLWSHDVSKIDPMTDKKLIIGQVLNHGSQESTDWLFHTYTKNEISTAADQIPLGQWDKKSLALWSLVLDIHPQPKAVRVLHDR